ncbi:MAG: lysophospholipase [Candidatus Heimdallarchaeaceae archaeon]
MEHIETNFTGGNNLQIYYQIFNLDKPKAVVQIAHGFAEHSGRYKKLIDALVEKNIAVYINDHQGYGKSEGKRNYIKSLDHYVADLHTITKMIRVRFPKLPIFLLGHSMGSFIAHRYAIKYQSEIKGLILSGSGTHVTPIPKVLQILARIMNKILPAFQADSGIKPEQISSDPESVKDYSNDPLIGYKTATASIGVCLMDHYREIKDQIGTISIPILLQNGENDTLMFDKETLFDDLKSKDKTLEIYKNAKHEVYTEIKEIREKAYSDLIDWINEHL